MDRAETSRSLAFSIFLILIFELIWFGAILPPTKISMPLLYSGSFFGWGAFGFFGAWGWADKSRGAKAALLFAGLVGIGIALDFIDRQFEPVLFAFPCFYAGIVASALVVILSRLTKHTT